MTKDQRTQQSAYWRERTPTVLQMEAVECGAAALAIVMGYYRKFVPLEQLRQVCGVSRDGSKASNVVKAARTYGFEAKGYRYEPSEVLALRQPVIVFWNFNHFLVVEGVSKAGVHLNDPATGPRIISSDEFDQGFTGVVLQITPGPDFKPEGQPDSVLSGLRKRLPLREPALLYLVIAGLLLVLPGLVLPVFSKVFIDEYLIGRMDSWIKPLLIGMAVTMVLQGILTGLQRYYLARFHAKLAMATSSQFLWHVLRLPVVFYAQRSAGDISGRVGINNRVAELMTGELATTLLNLVVLVFYAALMLSYDVLLTLVGVGVAAINIVVLQRMSRQRKDVNQKLANDHGKLLGTSMNGLQMIETLKASGTESDFFSKWAGHHAKVVNGMQTTGGQGVLRVGVPLLLSTMNNVLILSLGGLRVMEGALTMGALVAFQSLMASFLQPVNQLVALGASIQEMEGDMKRLDDVLKYAAESDGTQAGETPSETSTDRLQGVVELRDISFGYSKLEPPLLENFNLTLRPGARVALVGASGCGKSTISRLVMGLYEPWSGEILFDGRPRHQWPRATLVNSLSMVSQEIALFEGGVRENLSLWDDTLPEAELIRAAQDACIHDVLVTRPGGYESPVLEGGVNFSGGQRQRLEIARALAINPRILVLDEATSALDPLTEQKIDDNLRRRGCTCLIVAHRLSTIRDCDEIIVLDRGRVVQRGTHEDMRAVPGPYAELMQAGEEASHDL